MAEWGLEFGSLSCIPLNDMQYSQLSLIPFVLTHTTLFGKILTINEKRLLFPTRITVNSLVFLQDPPLAWGFVPVLKPSWFSLCKRELSPPNWICSNDT